MTSGNTTTADFGTFSRRGVVIFVIVVALMATAIFVGPREALVLTVGLGIGLLFEGMGFGFAGPWRRMILHRDPSGIVAQLLAIGLVAVVALPLLNSAPTELIGAHAPVGIAMVLGAFVFGIAMQIVLGCGSGTLINAGSGNPIALVALPFFALGSFFGAFHLFEWTAIGSLSVIIFDGLPGLGWTIGGLVLVAGVLWVASDKSKPLLNRKLAITAIILAALAVGHLVIAGQPWGVVYGLGLWVAKLATAIGINLDASQFWSHPVQTNRIAQSLLTDMTSLTNLGLVAGAFVISIWKQQGLSGKANRLPFKAWAAIIIAGFLLGYSSRLAFGCNVGAHFSGISTGSLHGWAWLVAAFAGSFVGIKLRVPLGLEKRS